MKRPATSLDTMTGVAVVGATLNEAVQFSSPFEILKNFFTFEESPSRTKRPHMDQNHTVRNGGSQSEVVGSNPASPSSRYSEEIVLSEDVPEGCWGSWVGQSTTESLLEMAL